MKVSESMMKDGICWLERRNNERIYSEEHENAREFAGAIREANAYINGLLKTYSDIFLNNPEFAAEMLNISGLLGKAATLKTMADIKNIDNVLKEYIDNYIPLNDEIERICDETI